MKRLAFWIIGVALGICMGIFLLKPRSPSYGSSDNTALVNELSNRVASLTAENARLSNQIIQKAQTSVKPNEPSVEVLRLRGEVGRLRQDLAEHQNLQSENARLREENRSLRPMSLNEMYYFSGFDTNQLPEIEMGTTRDEVLAELRRIGALVVEEKEKYISARVLPVTSTQAKTNLMPIAMDFYFSDEKRLTSRRDNFAGH